MQSQAGINGSQTATSDRLQRKPIFQNEPATTIAEQLDVNGSRVEQPLQSQSDASVSSPDRNSRRNARRQQQQNSTTDDGVSRPYMNPRSLGTQADEERQNQQRIMQQPDNNFRNREPLNTGSDAAEMRRQANREARRQERREQPVTTPSIPATTPRVFQQAPRQQESANSRPLARPVRKNKG